MHRPVQHVRRASRTLVGALVLLAVGFSAQGDQGSVQLARTEHQGTFGGHGITYATLVERTSLTLPGNAGLGGQVVSFAYLATGPQLDADRPVIFMFNGGPIVPSIYLHMMAFGPQRVAVPDDLKADPATFRLVDNPDTVLDRADIVFFDPIGTGYSRPASTSKLSDFFSVETDAQELAQFIVQWSAAHGRTASRKYLFAESYGTIRAAVAAKKLASTNPPVRVSGVFLLGQGLNIVETVQRPANVMSYVASLPTLAALGWYHQKVRRDGRSFESFIDEARRFARDEYLPALLQGSSLSPSECSRLAKRLESLTGLPASRFEAVNLRVSKMRFRAELLAAQGLVLGGYDGRYTAPASKAGPLPDGSEVLLEAADKAFSIYAKQRLGLNTEEPYVTRPAVTSMNDWKWGDSSPFGDWPYMANLRDAMEANKELRLFIGNGYEDTLTTVGAAEHAIAQSGWPLDRVTVRYYEGGHMSYSIERSHQQLMKDVRAMIDGASALVKAR